jgi:CheY-like chemotaxis protein
LSLIGNIEDLSLPDILQIIGLSGKSGLLTIRRGEEEGHIYLRQGRVILTFCPSIKRNLGSILLEKGLIEKSHLESALLKQRQEGGTKLLGDILVEEGVMDREILDQMVEEQIEESIFYFLTWQEGTFKFDLRDVDARHRIEIDPNAVISRKGIDTQWLILEGTRLLDEGRRKESSTVPEEKSPQPLTETRPKTVILVDDDPGFSDLFTEAMEKLGVSARTLNGVTEALETLSSAEHREDPFLVVDVVMPTSDGRGFLGGLELARVVRADYPEIIMRVITAYPDESIKEQLKELEIPPFLLKPELSEKGDSDRLMEEFCMNLLDELSGGAPGGEAPWERPTGDEITGGDKLKIVEEKIGHTINSIKTRLKEFPALQPVTDNLITEVEQSQSFSEIGLIILRLSSEVCERAILFKADKKEARGLGGFGFQANIMENRDGLRNLSLELKDSPSLLTAVHKLVPLRCSEYELQEDDIVSMVVGRPLAKEWIIIPVKGIEDSVLLLYGDSGASGKAIGEVELLADFLTFAGLSMEKIVWEERSAAS